MYKATFGIMIEDAKQFMSEVTIREKYAFGFGTSLALLAVIVFSSDDNIRFIEVPSEKVTSAEVTEVEMVEVLMDGTTRVVSRPNTSQEFTETYKSEPLFCRYLEMTDPYVDPIVTFIMSTKVNKHGEKYHRYAFGLGEWNVKEENLMTGSDWWIKSSSVDIDCKKAERIWLNQKGK